jgi:hypothetical protein
MVETSADQKAFITEAPGTGGAIDPMQRQMEEISDEEVVLSDEEVQDKNQYF